MKVKYYTKMLIPLCFFGMVFRVLELLFAVDFEKSLYKMNSIIPTMFDTYAVIVVIFFATACVLLPKSKREVARKFSKFSILETIVLIVAATLILAQGIKTFFFGTMEGSFATNISTFYKNIDFYMLLAAILSAVFLIQFGTYPKNTSKRSFWQFSALGLPLFYALNIFITFKSHGMSITRVYTSYEIVKAAAITLALMSFAKMMIGSFNKRAFITYVCASVFFTSIRSADLIVSFIGGNQYNVMVDILQVVCDIFVCWMLLIFTKKANKRIKMSPAKIPKQVEPEKEI